MYFSEGRCPGITLSERSRVWDAGRSWWAHTPHPAPATACMYAWTRRPSWRHSLHIWTELLLCPASGRRRGVSRIKAGILLHQVRDRDILGLSAIVVSQCHVQFSSGPVGVGERQGDRQRHRETEKERQTERWVVGDRQRQKERDRQRDG